MFDAGTLAQHGPPVSPLDDTELGPVWPEPASKPPPFLDVFAFGNDLPVANALCWLIAPAGYFLLMIMLSCGNYGALAGQLVSFQSAYRINLP